MPPKSNSKKGQASWYYCEACNAHITFEARETHERVCPLPFEAELGNSVSEGDIEYIRNGKLYTRSVQPRKFKIESLSYLPEKYTNVLLFMSEGAIRLANFHIGQHVVIMPAPEQEQPVKQLVRILWPVPDNFLTTVFVSEKEYRLHFSAQNGNLATIAALEINNLKVAANVILHLENAAELGLNQTQLKDAAAVIKQKIVDLIYCQSSKLHVKFFNKALILSVAHWHDQLSKGKVTVEEALAELSLDNNSQQFFQVTNATTVEILGVAKEQALKDPGRNYEITKADIGGLDDQIQLIEHSMEYALGYKFLPEGMKVSRGVLLYGATGCGKSMICEAMHATAIARAKTINTSGFVQLIRINSCELYSKYLGETEKKLVVHFDRAYAHYPQPTLILLEDVHNLCPKQESSEVVKRVSLAFLAMLDKLSSRREAQRTFLLATTSQIDALHPSIRCAGRLDSEIEVGPPTPVGRLDILNCLLRKVQHELNESEVRQVSLITHGYVGADLANLVYTATLAATKYNARPLKFKDLKAALTHIKPSAMREVQVEIPNVQWSDIGGQSALRFTLQQAIEWPLLHPEKFKRLGIRPPRGVLMFGPPGCSKTMIAKALATESKLNFLSIKGPELFSMWVGESERAVREVFRKARQVAPAIVFFDEIDAIGGERAESGGSGASVKDRVLTQLLTELDGVEDLKNVTIVAATNRPDMIDKALLRPGRIDRIVYVGMPDAAARREILSIKLQRMPLAEEVNLETLVELTKGYTGAEIQAVCHEAALHALDENFDAHHVQSRHFEYALNIVLPRTSPELLDLYQRYLRKK
ncbi:ATPase family protein 2 homolog [Scaptodrosophila lebanonensis]|uniref:ATPase family protein 2 homolog n=1 Tax=Drosophila lebanonensis TaxID=7225 RepID=A0A6J2U639_DROLE|nr:ATPase family protein 2 homolog [Scaptodrosophila lebanonensis]